MARVGADSDGTLAVRERARMAVGAPQWELAFETLSTLDESEALTAEELERSVRRLGGCPVYVTASPLGSARSPRTWRMDIRGRRHSRGVAAVLHVLGSRGGAIATGWLRRTTRLLEEEPEGWSTASAVTQQASWKPSCRK